MTPANTISSHFEKEKDLTGKKKKKIEITNEMLISKRIKKKKNNLQRKNKILKFSIKTSYLPTRIEGERHY